MHWIQKFKIALIQQNEEKISKTLDELPQFETVQQMQEAQTLIQEAQILLQEKKTQTALMLQELKKQKSFLQPKNNQPKLNFKW